MALQTDSINHCSGLATAKAFLDEVNQAAAAVAAVQHWSAAVIVLAPLPHRTRQFCSCMRVQLPLRPLLYVGFRCDCSCACAGAHLCTKNISCASTTVWCCCSGIAPAIIVASLFQGQAGICNMVWHLLKTAGQAKPHDSSSSSTTGQSMLSACQPTNLLNV